MAQPGGPMFDPDATAAARRKTQRRRALGAVALIVGAAALALVVQGRQGRQGRPGRQLRTGKDAPQAVQPGGPSIAAQLRAWHETAQPAPIAPDGPPVSLDLYERAEQDVNRAVEADAAARRSLEQAKAGGVARDRIDTLQERLAGRETKKGPPLSSERAL